MILWFQTPRKPVIGDGCDQEDTKDHQYAVKDKFQQQKVWFGTTVHHFDTLQHSTMQIGDLPLFNVTIKSSNKYLQIFQQ